MIRFFLKACHLNMGTRRTDAADRLLTSGGGGVTPDLGFTMAFPRTSKSEAGEDRGVAMRQVAPDPVMSECRKSGVIIGPRATFKEDKRVSKRNQSVVSYENGGICKREMMHDGHEQPRFDEDNFPHCISPRCPLQRKTLFGTPIKTKS